MQNVLNFNRHEEMNGSTRSDILSLIRKSNLRSIENCLYGLFDGYFYASRINEMINSETLSENEKSELQKLFNTISNYKSLK